MAGRDFVPLVGSRRDGVIPVSDHQCFVPGAVLCLILLKQIGVTARKIRATFIINIIMLAYTVYPCKGLL
jgi:hypothetical protein